METLEAQPPPSAPAYSQHPSRRTALKDLALAASLSTLAFTTSWIGILFDTNHGYFNKIPVTPAVLLALATNLLLFTGLFWLAAQFVRRRNSALLKTIAAVVICCLLLIPLNILRREFWGIKGVSITGALSNPWIWPGIIIIAAALLWRPAWFLKSIYVAVLIVSPLAVLIAGKMSVQFVRANDKPLPTQPNARTADSSPGPHVVWLIFDEFDQRIAFAERPRSIVLPELDRIRNESLAAAHAYPPAGSTLHSIPSLTIGKIVNAARIIGRSELALGVQDAKSELYWSKETNVFGRAQSIGARTAAIGWFHPYGRVFRDTLDLSAWHAFPPFEPARGETFFTSLVNQLWALVAPVQERRLYVQLFERSIADAVRWAADPACRLLFFHSPVPHSPGIYDLARGKTTITSFSYCQGYFDNYLLVDQTLRQLRQAMEAAGTWQNTWLIISSDHWWRDAHRYDGKIDHRVPFLVRAPQAANAPQTYPHPFNTVVTADLILAILGGEVKSLSDVSSWLDTHRVPPPQNYSSAKPHDHAHP